MAVEHNWRMVQHHLGCLEGAICYAGTELVSLTCSGMRTARCIWYVQRPLRLWLHAPCEPANIFLFSRTRRLRRVSVVPQVILDYSPIKIAKKDLTLCLHNWGCCSRKQSHLMALGSTLGLRFYTIFFLLLIIWTWENTSVGVCNSVRSHSVFEFFRMF